MDTGLGSGITHYTDRLAWAFAGAGIGLRALPADWQAAQMANTSVTFDTLESLEIHTDFAAQVAFDHVLAILNRMHDLRKLLFRQVLSANARINIRLRQDVFGIAGPNPVDVAQCDIDSLIRGNFNTNNTSHKKLNELALPLFVSRVGADHTNDSLAANYLTILAKLLN
jgi:hypothetical protein